MRRINWNFSYRATWAVLPWTIVVLAWLSIIPRIASLKVNYHHNHTFLLKNLIDFSAQFPLFKIVHFKGPSWNSDNFSHGLHLFPASGGNKVFRRTLQKWIPQSSPIVRQNTLRWSLTTGVWPPVQPRHLRWDFLLQKISFSFASCWKKLLGFSVSVCRLLVCLALSSAPGSLFSQHSLLFILVSLVHLFHLRACFRIHKFHLFHTNPRVHISIHTFCYLFKTFLQRERMCQGSLFYPITTRLKGWRLEK